jgi:hypothetical protein
VSPVWSDRENLCGHALAAVGPRTLNARLAAIHSLFRFAALRHPEHAALIARVLAVPAKRVDRAV